MTGSGQMAGRMAGRIWWLAAGLAEPPLRLLLRRRLARGKELPGRFGERRGRPTLPRPQGALLWLHAASVGETVSVMSLAETLCGIDPGLKVLMTTGSVTAQRLLAQRLQERGLTGRVLHQFVPFDIPRWLNRFLDHWRPDAMALVESELWPNLIACANRRGIPMALINARLSARSHRRWQKLPGLARLMLSRFRWITARSDEDAERLRALGAVSVGQPGDLKAAASPLPVDERELRRLRRLIGTRPLLLAASTHDGEEAVIAQAHRILSGRLPDLLTIIAPRHPERGAAIAGQFASPPRRGLGQDPGAEDGFWICDTLGELGLLYRLCPVAFIGNSLEATRPGGGHNPFEPTRLGCAISIGPLSFNFNDAIRDLREAGAIEVTPTAEAIAAWAHRLLTDPVARHEMARAGRHVAERASDLVPELAARLLDLSLVHPGRS